jgi:NADPH-dependent 2,4-dienoyl-CoA reductase/sulfur reductase-like enzyme
VVIVGGGSAGLAVAAQLNRKLSAANNDIAIIEPKSKHYYQPLWTLVGGGVRMIFLEEFVGSIRSCWRYMSPLPSR